MRDFQSFLRDAEQIAGAKFNAEGREHARQVYAEMVGLDDAEKSAKAYAAKRKRGLGFSETEQIDTDDDRDEDGSVRKRLRDWYRRTGRVTKG